MVDGAHGHVRHAVRLVMVGHKGVLEVVIDLDPPVEVKIVLVQVSTILLATVFAVQVRDYVHITYIIISYDCILCTVRYLAN